VPAAVSTPLQTANPASTSAVTDNVQGTRPSQPTTAKANDITNFQSFFDPLPAGADLYLLRGVLNDWPDREALAILRRCSEAARPAGRVVILKSVGPDEATKELNIEMVLLGGKRRTVAEFRELARQAGLELLAAGQQKSYFVVECRPA
jgi:hypothetical protein